MNRIGSNFVQQSALLNLQRARAREAEAADAVSTGRAASDLKGFGRDSEQITALKTVQSRVAAWSRQAEALAGKLAVQDAYLTEADAAAGEFRAALQEALATDHGEGLVTRVSAAFQKAAGALNGTHQGQYLFAGARLDQRPFAADRLADLTAVPAAADLFNNDGLKSAARLDETVVIQTGELAAEVGGALMERFRRFQAFVEGPDGAFEGKLTAAQKAFIEGELPGLGLEGRALTDVVGRNGVKQAQVDGAIARLEDRSVSLAGLLADRTEVDPAEAVTALNQAQIAVEATAKVFTMLKSSSLLELLR